MTSQIPKGPNGIPDANPEMLIVGAPLDGTKNPHVAVGQKFEDITGVIQYQSVYIFFDMSTTNMEYRFGFFYILPTTAPVLVSSPSFTVPPTTITASNDPCVVTVGDYNVSDNTCCIAFQTEGTAD